MEIPAPDHPEVLWWIITTLVAILTGLVGLILFLMQRWQERVERRLRAYHKHGNMLQYLLFLVQTMYVYLFHKDPPPPPEDDDES